MKCDNCNYPIKRAYTWDSMTLGIDCWKKIALPEIMRMREEKWAQYKKDQWMKDYALVEAIKQKDFSKIKSEFKINFLKSLITQFEEKGFISPAQRELVYGTHTWRNGFYDTGMFNKKDDMNELIAKYKIGFWPKEHVEYLIDALYPNEKDKQYIQQAII